MLFIHYPTAFNPLVYKILFCAPFTFTHILFTTVLNSTVTSKTWNLNFLAQLNKQLYMLWTTDNRKIISSLFIATVIQNFQIKCRLLSTITFFYAEVSK